MNNEMTNFAAEGLEMDNAELETIAAALPVQSSVRAGAMPPSCCDPRWFPH